MSIEAKVTLVGAGPGDPDLISLKGIKAIQKADVILYDALVNDELLDYAKADCIKIYVGKRAEQLSTSQDEINRLLVDYALNYGHVVRLKGGDPFVFGRGGEEIDHVAQYGIETAVIPGISSAIGLTGLQQIPLTYRGISESFWVITGSKSDGSLSSDLYLAAESNATVVVLMGYGKLAEIVSIYQQKNLHHLPIALIQNGSLPNEKVVLGTIDNILDESTEKRVGVPAIIIIGEVVAKHRSFQQIKEKALAL
ncbi:uroporphyrinogen-III C-methyltransferase [Sphingobacterium sp. DR205]|uniref:uroporphyrinogen-III C-methyltransferase n=1 Tax=Sphingobacterium sp. DR205 TaxID=2713573 RepID=UPI0013E5039A|nr:uroporphyrinogen-III C-methyltransferase [Sphingobacterium sp. DR205]QIH33900.1 uroporphyrinogen-III C-methyltransferase [Sphingobacterium sp. DR205]